ncbi:hypothetical protein D3C75_880340 [compost metagenome]
MIGIIGAAVQALHNFTEKFMQILLQLIKRIHRRQNGVNIALTHNHSSGTDVILTEMLDGRTDQLVIDEHDIIIGNILFRANLAADDLKLFNNPVQIARIQEVEYPPLAAFRIHIFAAVLLFILPVHDASGTIDYPLLNQFHRFKQPLGNHFRCISQVTYADRNRMPQQLR